MLVKDDRGSWYEDYHRDSVVDQESAEREGRGIIDYWNSTLHPGDRPREFVSVVLDAGDATRGHKWEKTSLMTLSERGRMFDRMACARCGVTAKRYGFEGLIYDSDYRAKAFRTCDGAQALLTKRAAKAAQKVSPNERQVHR
jgi:hypothetical protein